VDRQKTFEDLHDKKKLSYDFYLKDFNLLIEFQGAYHDGSLIGKMQTEDEFKYQVKHDNMKRNYAKEHNYILKEIWYYDKRTIENILEEIFKEVN